VKRTYSTTLLAIATAVLTTIPGCANSTGQGVNAKNSSNVDVSALDCDRDLTPEDVLNFPVPKANERYKITFLVISLAGYYYNAEVSGAQLAAEKAGVDVSVVAAQGFSTAPEQITQAENALTRGTDAIVLNPVDVNASAPIIDMAKRKGVPTIVVGTLVDTDDAAQVVQDDYRQGQAAADALAARLPDGGKGIVMAGPANATWSVGRTQGFLDRVGEKYPDITVTAVANSNVDPGEGLAKFTNAASSNPAVDWIYPVYNGLLPPDSIPAHYRDAVLVTGGLDPSTRGAVGSGKAIVIPDWPVHTGYIGVAEAVAALNGQAPPKLTCLPSPVVAQADLDSQVGKAQFFPWSPK
jgi:ribose transport system substrate-binding protein